jgi:flagellar basal body-associated protein FliL
MIRLAFAALAIGLLVAPLSSRAEAAEAATPAVGPAFVPLRPMSVPVIDDKGVNKIVTFKVVLEAKDGEAKGKIETNLNRLSDRFVQRLFAAVERNVLLREGNLYLPQLKYEMTEASTAVLGDGVVTNILVQGVSLRQL